MFSTWLNATLCDDKFLKNMAESEGFEPPDGFPSTVFKPANSTLIYKDFFLKRLKTLSLNVILDHIESYEVSFGVSQVCPKIIHYLTNK